MYACMYVCMHACMHVCMYVYMYVCVYVYIYIYIYIYYCECTDALPPGRQGTGAAPAVKVSSDIIIC